jgi:hypothetical protein
MSDLAVIDPGDALELADDPGAFVVMALERGKSWLAEALEHGDLDALVNAKGWAATLRTAVMQKQLGHDAELSATELVRRAERCIGLGIRQGQKEGEIASRGHNNRQNSMTSSSTPRPISDFVPPLELTSGGNQPGYYALTDDVSDEQFEDAIVEAKTERNLSRANVVRKVKGEPTDERVQTAARLAASAHTTSQIAAQLGYGREGMTNFLKRHGIEVPADSVVGKQRNFDSRRIVATTIDAVNGIGSLFDRIDYAALDPEDVNGWLPVLNDSIRSLTTLRNRLKEVSQP